LRALDGLNPAQREAVQTTRGPLLIVAGPGSGKTRVIVHRIAYLVEHEGVSPYQILAVTFTNKAAREMRERVARLLGREADGLAVGTFHWWCARVLRRDGVVLGIDPHFVIYDETDQVGLIREVIREASLDEKRVPPRAVLAHISRAKSELVDADTYARRAEGRWPETVAPLYRRYQELLARNRALDFDDLLLGVVTLFRDAPEVLAHYQERYQYLLIDEFQDTNIAQYELVRLLGGRYRNVCAVGDVDQAIYSWRAADPRNVFHFQRDFPELTLVRLEQNYRSTQAILDVADAIIRQAPNRIPKRLWTTNPRGAPVVLHEAYDEGDEALYVAREIEQLVRTGQARYQDCAVLYRTNAQSRALEDVFVRRGLPYRLVGGTRFYERKEVKDVLAYLRLLLNPHDSTSLRRVINVPPRGLGEKTLAELERWAARHGSSLWEALQRAVQEDAAAPDAAPRLAPQTRHACARFMTLLEGLRETAATRTVRELIDAVLEQTGYAAYLRDGTEEGEERWANVLELRAKAAEYDELSPAVGLSSFLEEVSLVQDVDALDGSGDAVTLLTLHAAKGLEFGHVFLVGLEEGLCPHARSFADPAAMDEERRLFFVGATRAMHRLYLVYAFRRNLHGNLLVNTPSRFLADIPAHLLTGTGVARLEAADGARDQPRAATAGRAEAPPARRPPGPQFRAGDRVRHAHFGTGIVVSSQLVRDDEEVVVAFEGVGVKKLSVAYARLERF